MGTGASHIATAPILDSTELSRFFLGRRSLTDELANFAKAKVAAGRKTSSGEVVRQALRLMEKLERQEVEKLSFLPKAARRDRQRRGPDDRFTTLKKEARAVPWIASPR